MNKKGSLILLIFLKSLCNYYSHANLESCGHQSALLCYVDPVQYSDKRYTGIDIYGCLFLYAESRIALFFLPVKLSSKKIKMYPFKR